MSGIKQESPYLQQANHRGSLHYSDASQDDCKADPDWCVTDGASGSGYRKRPRATSKIGWTGRPLRDVNLYLAGDEVTLIDTDDELADSDEIDELAQEVRELLHDREVRRQSRVTRRLHRHRREFGSAARTFNAGRPSVSTIANDGATADFPDKTYNQQWSSSEESTRLSVSDIVFNNSEYSEDEHWYIVQRTARQASLSSSNGYRGNITLRLRRVSKSAKRLRGVETWHIVRPPRLSTECNLDEGSAPKSQRDIKRRSKDPIFRETHTPDGQIETGGSGNELTLILRRGPGNADYSFAAGKGEKQRMQIAAIEGIRTERKSSISSDFYSRYATTSDESIR